MNAVKRFKYFIGLFFLINIPQLVKANDGKPVLHFTITSLLSQRSLIDTLPPKVKSLDEADSKPGDEIIKVVPKARKQLVPLPVSLQVRPTIIIKPNNKRILQIFNFTEYHTNLNFREQINLRKFKNHIGSISFHGYKEAKKQQQI